MQIPGHRIHAPLMPVTVCFVTGIVAYVCHAGLWLAIAATLLAVACLFFNRYFTVLSLCLLLGVCDAYVAIPLGPPEGLIGKSYVCRGEVSELRESDAAQVLLVRVDAVGPTTDRLQSISSTKVQVIVPGFERQFEVGDIATFEAELRATESTTDLPDEIDPAILLARKHVYLDALVTDNDFVAIDSHPSSIKSWAAHMKTRVAVLIDESRLSPSAKEFLKASLIGDTTYLGDEMRERFSAAGTSHILAISGLHVGVIALVVSLALWPLYICGYSKLRWLFVIAAIWLFAIVTGLSASVVRASVMTTVFVGGRLMQRNTSPVNTLCLAALVILLFNPAAIFDIGFQLSFAAVLSILLFAQRLNPVSPRRRVAYNICSYISVSICAMLGTGLLSAIYFHSFPFYFLIGNIFVCTLLPFILGGGIVIAVCESIGVDSAWICTAVSRLCDCLLATTDFITSLRGARIDRIYLEAWTIVPLIASAIALKKLLDRHNIVRAVCFTASVAILLASVLLQHPEPIGHRVYLSRDKRHTELVIPTHDGQLLLVTTLPTEPNTVSQRAEFRYSDYMLRRGIDSVVIDTANHGSDRLVTVGPTKLALISGKAQTIENQKVDYAILCRGFKDEIYRIIDSYEPDTIILASDLHPKRAARYKSESEDAGTPCIWLRERPWSMGYDSSSKPLVK